MTKENLELFFETLEGPKGCDFKKDEAGRTTWKCGCGMDQSLATGILDEMGVSQAERDIFLELCTENGGHCDCEILFNAEERILESLTE